MSVETTTLERDDDDVLSGLIDTLGNTRDDTVHQLELADRLAALTVRRQTNQHHCRAVRNERGDPVCDHPEHRRDVFYCLEMLDLLGLDHAYPVVTDEERQEYVGGVASHLPRGNRPQGVNFGRRWNDTVVPRDQRR